METNHNLSVLDKLTYLKPTVIFGSETIHAQNHSPLPLIFLVPKYLSRRPKAEGPREKPTNTSVATSEAQDKESTETISKKNDLASTMESRRRVPHPQEATQAIGSPQQDTAEERQGALLQTEIERIRQHYREQEKILKWEYEKLKQKYKEIRQQLENEEKDEKNYPVAEWWEVDSDYEPTLCGDEPEGSR